MPTETPTWDETEEAVPAWEETTETSPQGLTPFTGHIPFPPGYDPVTGHRQYGGPWSGALTGPYREEGMQEAIQTLGAPLRAAGALTEGLMDTAAEISADWRRRTGIDPSARPGEPAVNVPPSIFKYGALHPIVSKLFPEATKGVEEEGAKILSSFTAPGQAETLPAAMVSKPMQALYLAQAGLAIPESVQRIYQAKGPEELGAAITGGAANIGMAELMRRGLTRPTPMERLQEYAQTVRGDKEVLPQAGQVTQEGQGIGGPDVYQAGGRPQGAPSFPQETQVLLDQGLANNRSLGIGHELEVMPDFGAADPTHRKVFQATAPTVNAEGKVTSPGKIRMSKAAFDMWNQEVLSKVNPTQRTEAIHGALAEEGIHATITKKMARDYLKTLTPAEIAAGKKLYLGGVSEAEAGLTETNLGQELLRQRMQRLLRMKPTELAEAKGFEKWSRATIEALANTIRTLRELVGTAAAKAGGMITDELLNRYEQNLNAVAKASGEKEPFEDIYGGEQPFMIRRGAGEKKPQDIAGMDDASVTKYLADLKGKGIGPQYDSVVAGMKLSDKDLPDLTRLHEESGRKMLKALESGDQKAFEAEFGKNVWYAGAIEGARRSGPNYERLQAEAANAEIPGLPPIEPGTVRVYHGEGGPEGAGMFSQWYSEDPSRAASYGGQVSYVDIPASVAQHTKALAKKAGSGTSFDHFLPEEWAVRSQAVPDEVRQKVYDLGPSALRRGKAKGQRELYLPPAEGQNVLRGESELQMRQAEAQRAAGLPGVPQTGGAKVPQGPGIREGDLPLQQVPPGTSVERPSAAELAFKPATAFNVERSAYGHLQEATDKVLEQYDANPTAKIKPPSFKEFSKNLQVEFGQMKPGAIVDQWQRTVWSRLLNASGRHLEALRQSLNLRAKLGDRVIADPPPRGKMRLEQEVAPGEARAQLSAEEKGAAARQKYRNNVIAQVGEALMKEARESYQLDRKSITPEDIGFGRKSLRDAWNTLTKDDRDNPEHLASVLTDDAREMGLPVSNTKRVTVLQNIGTGKVEMVSTYRDPRRGAVLLDPDAPGKTHSPLQSILKRWRPVQSILLDEPVKNFQQSYDSLSDFEEKFGKDARARSITETSKYPEPRQDFEPEADRPGSWEARTPITDAEAGSIMDAILAEQGTFEGPDDVKEMLSSQTLQRNRAAVSGLRKLAATLDRKFPNLSTEELIDRLSTQLYENHAQAKTLEDFQRRTVSQGAAPNRPDPGVGAQAGPTAESAARAASEEELTGPAVLRRTKERAEQEFHGIVGRVQAVIARAGKKDELSRLRDKAGTVATNMSQAAKRNIEQPSSTARQKRGDPKMLAAARAINAVYEQGAPNPAALPHLLQMTRLAQRKATQLTLNPTDATLAAVGLPEIKGQSRGEILSIGRQWLRSAEALEKEVQYAMANFGNPELMRTTQRLRKELADQLAFENMAGKATKEAENYLPGLYEGELYGDNSVTFDSVVLGKSYGKPKTFANQYEAIASGPFIPKMNNVADIAAHRVRSGLFSIWADQAFKAPLRMIDPATQAPIAIEAQPSPQGGYQVPGGNLQYKLIYPQGGGKPIAVRKGYAKLMDDLFGKSGIEDWIGGRALMKAGAIEKHTTLAADLYHLTKMGWYALAISRERMGFRGALTALEFRPNNMAEAVRRGVITQKAMDWALKPETVTIQGTPRTMTRQDILKRFQTKGGLNVGRIQDAMYKHFVDQLDFEIAGRRIGIGAYNRFLFDEWTRGLMANSAVEEFLRQTKAAPSIDADVIMRRISRDINTQFGSTGAQGLVKNPTLRDLGQLAFLAAQWTGSRIATEAKFLSRAVTTPYVLATQGKEAATVHAGTIGRGVGSGLLAMFGLTQALNLITRGRLTFQNPEKEHALDAWIPDGEGGPGHWISPLSIYMEMTHEVSRYMAGGGKNLGDTITQIGENKLSPFGRAALTGISGITPTGQHITTTMGRFREAGKALIPAPITLGPTLRTVGHAVAPSLVSPNRPGAISRQLLSSGGIKSEWAKDPLAEVQSLARDFAKEKGHEVPRIESTDDPSYAQLRAAVRRNDKEGTWKVLENLRARGKTDDQIDKAMRLWSERRFTWSKEAEDEFRWSLNPEQREKMAEAEYQRLAEYNRFIEFLMLEPHGKSD